MDIPEARVACLARASLDERAENGTGGDSGRIIERARRYFDFIYPYFPAVPAEQLQDSVHKDQGLDPEQSAAAP